MCFPFLTVFSELFLCWCSDECAALSLMSLHRSFVRGGLCLASNVLSLHFFLSPSILYCPPLSCSPLIPSVTPGARGTCCITCTCACMHTHAPLACHPVGPVISSSPVVFAPFFSVFNSPSCPPFTRSLHRRPWPQPTELSIQPFSSWMQILECDKSFRFLSSHFAVATKSKTLNTAPIVPSTIYRNLNAHNRSHKNAHTYYMCYVHCDHAACM